MKPTALHFHFGPRLSGVGVFIDTILTGEDLPWRTEHLCAEGIPSVGRPQTFFSGVQALVASDAPTVVAHTLKAGLAAAVAKHMRHFRLIYVGHGVRAAQLRQRRPIYALLCLLAENIVYHDADLVWHIRKIDLEDGARISILRQHRHLRLLEPRIEDLACIS